MPRILSSLLTLLLLSVSGIRLDAADKPDRPLQALLVTGGCCHDYARPETQILTKGTAARADIVWTIVHQGGSTTDTKIPLYDDPNWADGFDVIIPQRMFRPRQRQRVRGSYLETSSRRNARRSHSLCHALLPNRDR